MFGGLPRIQPVVPLTIGARAQLMSFKDKSEGDRSMRYFFGSNKDVEPPFLGASGDCDQLHWGSLEIPP